MRQFSSSLCAALAFSLALGTVVPAMAAPAFVPKAPAVSSDLIQVQNNRADRRENRAERRADRRERRADRREDRRENRADRRDDRRDRFERRGNSYYYNGRRGYRERRTGYREYNGWWFPAAAFLGGVITGTIIETRPAVTYRVNSAHVEWCQNRWRSYRVSDNSYQPYNGPRRICSSPHG